MFNHFQKKSLVFRCLAGVINLCFIASFITPTRALAQSPAELGMPKPGTMISLTSAYVPVMARGLRVHPENPILFDFIMDAGNSGLNVNDPQLKKESEKIIKYFLASLTIPGEDLWVNLSPYEKNRIINEQLGQTEMGRDMLAQDYILKQLTASLIYPEKSLGKEFWNRIYSKSQQMFGTTEIPVNTFNKVWIVADKADIYVHDNTAFVVSSHLKVMMEEDYLSLTKHNGIVEATVKSKKTNEIGSQVVRDIVLPELEKEVNTGKNFANLRQIFHSMVLASWYKKNLKTALLNQVYSNKAKINGVDVSDKTIKDQIYQEYLKAYKKGVFNYIKEDNSNGQSTPRKYFSGGLALGVDKAMNTIGTAQAQRGYLQNPIVKAFGVQVATPGAKKTGPDSAMLQNLSVNKKDAAMTTLNLRLVDDRIFDKITVSPDQVLPERRFDQYRRNVIDEYGSSFEDIINAIKFVRVKTGVLARNFAINESEDGGATIYLTGGFENLGHSNVERMIILYLETRKGLKERSADGEIWKKMFDFAKEHMSPADLSKRLSGTDVDQLVEKTKAEFDLVKLERDAREVVKRNTEEGADDFDIKVRAEMRRKIQELFNAMGVKGEVEDIVDDNLIKAHHEALNRSVNFIYHWANVMLSGNYKMLNPGSLTELAKAVKGKKNVVINFSGSKFAPSTIAHLTFFYEVLGQTVGVNPFVEDGQEGIPEWTVVSFANVTKNDGRKPDTVLNFPKRLKILTRIFKAVGLPWRIIDEHQAIDDFNGEETTGVVLINTLYHMAFPDLSPETIITADQISPELIKSIVEELRKKGIKVVVNYQFGEDHSRMFATGDKKNPILVKGIDVDGFLISLQEQRYWASMAWEEYRALIIEQQELVDAARVFGVESNDDNARRQYFYEQVKAADTRDQLLKVFDDAKENDGSKFIPQIDSDGKLHLLQSAFGDVVKVVGVLTLRSDDASRDPVREKHVQDPQGRLNLLGVPSFQASIAATLARDAYLYYLETGKISINFFILPSSARQISFEDHEIWDALTRQTGKATLSDTFNNLVKSRNNPGDVTRSREALFLLMKNELGVIAKIDKKGLHESVLTLTNPDDPADVIRITYNLLERFNQLGQAHTVLQVSEVVGNHSSEFLRGLLTKSFTILSQYFHQDEIAFIGKAFGYNTDSFFVDNGDGFLNITIDSFSFQKKELTKNRDRRVRFYRMKDYNSQDWKKDVSVEALKLSKDKRVNGEDRANWLLAEQIVLARLLRESPERMKFEQEVRVGDLINGFPPITRNFNELIVAHFDRDSAMSIESNSGSDFAEISTPLNVNRLPGQDREGGIDLNSDNLQLNTRGDQINIKFDPALINQFKRGDFSGVYPVILNISPITNVFPLLGLKEEEEHVRELAKV